MISSSGNVDDKVIRRKNVEVKRVKAKQAR